MDYFTSLNNNYDTVYCSTHTPKTTYVVRTPDNKIKIFATQKEVILFIRGTYTEGLRYNLWRHLQRDKHASYGYNTYYKHTITAI